MYEGDWEEIEPNNITKQVNIVINEKIFTLTSY